MINFSKLKNIFRKNKGEQNNDPIEQEVQCGAGNGYEMEEGDENNDIAESSEQNEKAKVVLGNVSNMKLISVMVICFLLYQIFYSESNLRICVKTQNEINECRAEIERLDYELKQDCVIIYGIKNNKTYLIKYARENLYLSGRGEDIYIVED